MTEQQATPVIARWAWISAEPGAGDGAGILATSDPNTNFGVFIGRFPTGSPRSTARPEEPDAPPWVTFGPFWQESGEILLSVSVRGAWEQPDPQKRPVSPQRFFLCRFADLAAAAASYQTAWEAIDPVTLSAAVRQPVQLGIRPQPLEELVAAITYYGFDRLALLAAVLLQARVAVKDAATLNRDERLAVIDAVAALLPYGFRADLSASSCVKETAVHKIRLVFAEFTSSDDQLLLPLQGAEPKLRPGVALSYLKMLREKEKISGLDSVVAHLWNAKKEYTFRRPGDALDVLSELDPVLYFVAMLRDINLTREQMLMFFRQPETVVRSTWNHPDVSDAIRDRALGLLLLRRDDHVAGILRTYWETVISSVSRFALRGLDEGNQNSAEWFLRVASEVPDEAEDDLLARLLTTEQADRGERHRDALVALLLNLAAPPAQGTFRATCDELRGAHGGTGHERLVRQLLVREISGRVGSPGAVNWAQWLCKTSLAERREGLEWPDWMLALSCVLSGASGQLPFTTVSSLIWRDPDWAVVLRLAEQAGHLAEILSEIWRDLVQIAVQLAVPDGAVQLAGPDGPVQLAGPDGQARRGTVLADALSFDSSRLAGDMIAVVDAVRVLLGRPPGDFLRRADQPAFALYDRGLEMVFGLQAVQRAVPLLERGFLDHAVRTTPWPEGVIWLMKSWAADLYRAPGLARYVVDKKMAVPLLRYGQLDGAFWEQLVTHEADLKAFASGPILRTAAKRTIERPADELRRAREHNSVPATELASVMCEAFISGMQVEGILGVLMHSASADGNDLTSIAPEELDKVLRQFQGLLFYDGRRNFEDISFEALLEFYLLISGGALGQAFGRKFARRVKKVLRGQIRSRRRAIRVLSRGARGRFGPRVRVPGARGRRRGVPASHGPYRGEGAGGAG